MRAAKEFEAPKSIPKRSAQQDIEEAVAEIKAMEKEARTQAKERPYQLNYFLPGRVG